ncbi:hypothetical protein HJG60_011909 [Phyllostomus discolor]|uniref:Uncharacterized protein n=1 Tax=Phyllostomus discolor TaxID=89673 RepID=A0A834DWG7_9CHIR|nr:hypothetical protein HJG60_011909 [Phyllostomus discolor]
MLKFAKYRRIWFGGDVRSELSVSLFPPPAPPPPRTWTWVQAHYGRASRLERPPPSMPDTFCHWSGSSSSELSLSLLLPTSLCVSLHATPSPSLSLPPFLPLCFLFFHPFMHSPACVDNLPRAWTPVGGQAAKLNLVWTIAAPVECAVPTRGPLTRSLNFISTN